MSNTFSPTEYLDHLARQLVFSFGSGAGLATTPTLVGSAREKVVREQLENLLPLFVGVGSGCIIDTNKNTSSQTDIVLYEKSISPVFSINGLPESTYYPCENVIAVGEVKSTLTKQVLDDAFKKIVSVKSLTRYEPSKNCYRHFGSSISMSDGGDFLPTPTNPLSPTSNIADQIFGFILCKDFGGQITSLTEHFSRLVHQVDPWLVPNIIVSLESGCIVFGRKDESDLTQPTIFQQRLWPKGATGVFHANLDNNFGWLINNLNLAINRGRTVSRCPIEKYLAIDEDIIRNITFTDWAKLDLY